MKHVTVASFLHLLHSMLYFACRKYENVVKEAVQDKTLALDDTGVTRITPLVVDITYVYVVVIYMCVSNGAVDNPGVIYCCSSSSSG